MTIQAGEQQFLTEHAPDIMDIVRAGPDDATTLTQIAFDAKRHWGYPERYIQSWTAVLAITPEFISKNETYAAVIGGRMVGFYALRERKPKLHLEHMWVSPKAMRQGVGRLLFAHAIERVRALGFLTLEIESDPNAEGFYLRMGARRLGANITEFEGKPRVLPIFAYEIDTIA